MDTSGGGEGAKSRVSRVPTLRACKLGISQEGRRLGPPFTDLSAQQNLHFNNRVIMSSYSCHFKAHLAQAGSAGGGGLADGHGQASGLG